MSEILLLVTMIIVITGLVIFLEKQIEIAKKDALFWMSRYVSLEDENLELQRGYNDSQKEILILKNHIRRLQNELTN